jgi:hypothetical protein
MASRQRHFLFTTATYRYLVTILLLIQSVHSRIHSYHSSQGVCAFCSDASFKSSFSRRARTIAPEKRGAALQFFATPKDNKSGDREPNKEEERDQDIDFPTWVSALKEWPLRPSRAESKAIEQDGDGQGEGETKTKTIARPRDDFLSPLAKLIGMEALLKANEGKSSKTRVSLWNALSETSSLDENKYNASFIPADVENGVQMANALNISALETMEALSGWDQWIGTLSKSVYGIASSADKAVIGKSAEGILSQATARIESLLSDASSVVSPTTIQTLIEKASESLRSSAATNDLIEVAKQMALDRGLDVSEAADRARETTAYASKLVTIADGVLRKGYIDGDIIPKEQTLMEGVPAVAESRALFADFTTASEINSYGPVIAKASEMADLSGAVYEENPLRTLEMGHSIVAQGMTADVVWMVTDSIANATAFKDREEFKKSKDPVFVRTITIRGFDASDDKTDRARVLNRICDATPEKIKAGNGGVFVHSGLMGIAREVYDDVKQYIAWTTPDHRIVLNGHSIGGSVSQLLLILMTMEQGAEFVQKKVLRCYTFGCPPVIALRNTPKTSNRKDHCSILDSFDLPSSLVHGFVQPWDPIVRLFSNIDSLYPLVGDIGKDGVTPFSSGPPRTLRPITKAIIEAWDGWPRFRDVFKDTIILQNYTTVGIQHILLPEPTRYLGDRFVSVNIAVPQVETVLRLSPGELLPALEKVFPLDVFEISFVPQAIRSFVHHFFPAYGLPFVVYVKNLEREAKGLPTKSLEEEESTLVQVNGGVKPSTDPESSWELAAQWLKGKERVT